MNTKIRFLSLLLVALVGAGYSSTNKATEVENDELKLVVRNVLRQNATDNTGAIVNEVEAPAANGLVSDVLAQVNTPLNDKINIRFVAGIDSYTYETAHFNITMKDLEGTVVKERKISVATAYLGVEVEGETKYAEDLWGEGYNYLIACTLEEVPEDYWNYKFDVTASVGELGTSANVQTKVIGDMADYNVKVNMYNVDGTKIGSRYEKVALDTIYTINAPAVDGLVASHDYVKGYLTEGKDTHNIYYSELDVWDGTSVSASLSGAGTEEDPYLIQSAADLAYFRNQVDNGNTYAGEYVKMTVSIDLNNYENFMIGNSEINSFGGYFDGNNCSFRNIKLVRTASRSGLFHDILFGGSISNISVYGTSTGQQYTGSVVGYLVGNANNCTSYVNVTGGTANGVGGVFGGINNAVEVTNCVNYGNVKGTTSHTGGISSVTWSGSSIVKGCKNFGAIDGKVNVGGIIGNAAGLLSENYNYGTVGGADDTPVGGIVGITTGALSHNYNYGSIIGKGLTGGIVGSLKKTAEYCVNNGQVSSTAWKSGGIAGSIEAANCFIDNCVNNAYLTSTGQYLGGIVGTVYLTDNSVTNCTNNGLVDGKSGFNGGIIAATGTNGVATYENNINYGDVNSTGNAGGVISWSFGTSTIKNCYNYGTITGTTNEDICSGGKFTIV